MTYTTDPHASHPVYADTGFCIECNTTAYAANPEGPTVTEHDPFTVQHCTAMATAYAICALWASLTDDGNTLDDDYCVSDIAPETLSAFGEICRAFYAEHRDDLRQTSDGPTQWGHDLWLTRNGHGAGFWDRGYGPVGDRLSDAARALGESDLYVHDGKVYAE